MTNSTGPSSGDANAQAAQLMADGRLDQAHAVLARAVAADPDDISTACNLGGVMALMGRDDEAAAHLADLAERHPNHADTHYNLGLVHQSAGRMEAAAAAYLRVVELRPDYRAAHTNLSAAWRELGALDRALDAATRAITLAPDHGLSHFNRAYILLQMGQMTEGWAEHEWRFQAGITPPRPLPQPPWTGENMAGKTLLVWAEQGFGDTLQFVRFLPLLEAQGIRVVFEVQPELLTLLHGTAGCGHMIARGTALPPFDRHVALMSLPHLLGLRLDAIAQSPSTLSAPKRPSHPPGTPPRIGLAWAGSPTHKNDARRSLPSALARRLLDRTDFQWISLQRGDAAQVTATPGWERLLAPPPPRDFLDTARVVASLDLCITVDTAVAHIAGSLGCPVWLLLPFAPDWRWLQHREDSPWYPSMRLFRQSAPGAWDAVIRQVLTALTALPPIGG